MGRSEDKGSQIMDVDGNHMEERYMKNLKALMIMIAVIYAVLSLQVISANAGQKNILSKEESISKLIGKWNGYTIYYDTQERKYKHGAEQHCQIIKDAKGVKFIGENGQVLDEDNVYLSYKKGKFYGSYLAGKHGGTHGRIFKVKFTLKLKDNNTLQYDDLKWKHEFKKEE